MTLSLAAYETACCPAEDNGIDVVVVCSPQAAVAGEDGQQDVTNDTLLGVVEDEIGQHVLARVAGNGEGQQHSADDSGRPLWQSRRGWSAVSGRR